MARPDVYKGAGRQPRRDRRPCHPRARRARDRVGRRLLRGRPRRAARQARRPRPICSGPGPAAESYLNVDKLLEVIERSGAEAVHPGYGFLAENAAFARRAGGGGRHVHRAARVGDRRDGLQDQGARADAGRRRADRARARPSRSRRSRTPAKIAEDIGYPIAVKAAGGGGGKGFRVALEPDKLRTRSRAPRARARSSSPTRPSTSSATCPTRATSRSRCWPTAHGNVVHLGERDCSIQRRHQKLIEESPAPLVDDELRERIGKIAVDAARAVDYRGAGTIEGLLSEDGEYFFLEMNTRVQVEHCVTEAVTGVDIVREQILIAAGEPICVRPGRHPLARARDRVPDQRRGRGEELRARAGHGRALPRAVRAGRARRLRRARRARRSRRCMTRWSPS